MPHAEARLIQLTPWPGGRTGGAVTSKTQVTGKRVGDCDAPKAG
jgi:hypothetical protein